MNGYPPPGSSFSMHLKSPNTPSSSSCKEKARMVVHPTLKKVPTSEHLYNSFKEMPITPTHHVHFPLTPKTSRIAEIIRTSNSKKAERVKIKVNDKNKHKEKEKEEKVSIKVKDKIKWREKADQNLSTPSTTITTKRSSISTSAKLLKGLGISLGSNSEVEKSCLKAKKHDRNNGDVNTTKQHSSKPNGHILPIIGGNNNTSNYQDGSHKITNSTHNSPISPIVKDNKVIHIQKKKLRPQSYAEPRKHRSERPLSFAEPRSSRKIVVQSQLTEHLNYNIHQNLQYYKMPNYNTATLQNEAFNFSPATRDRPNSHINIHHSNFFDISNIIQTQNCRIAELEARLGKLRMQQRDKRNSVDFAISCVEPDPIYFSVDHNKVAGKPQDELGIYIKSVVKNGSADLDGRLATGDQLLTVDGQSLVGISQEEAAKYLMRTGPIVTLEVAKQAAVYQGLASMLNQSSPEISRGGFNASRRMSERDLPSKVDFTDPAAGGHLPPGHPLAHTRIQSSKSVPSLNSDQPQSTTVPPMVRSPGHPGSVPYGHNDQGPSHRPYPQHYPSASMTMHPSSKMSGIIPGGGMNDSHHPRSRSIQSLTDPPYRQ